MLSLRIASATLTLTLAVSAGAAAQPEEPRAAALDAAQLAVVAAAIDTLPKDLKKFYKRHSAELPSQAPEPAFPERGGERRFRVDRLLPYPFSELPRSEQEVKVRFGERAEGVGRLPWLLIESYGRLVEAFQSADKPRILQESDALAGLVVDMHSPLNLTENYDGQMTGQHGLWTRYTQKLPLAMGRMRLAPDAANYLDDPREYVFSMLLGTYVWLDNTLYLEELTRRGKAGYGEIYFEDLSRRLGPILRERLARAAEDSGSYWYTAWTVAGRPPLD
jgi:hypothetical protein